MKDPVRNMRWIKYPIGDITQYFGENPELYQKYGSTIAHSGIDIIRPYNEPMFAVEDGIVASVREGDTGFGNNVRIFSPFGKPGNYREWVHAHCSKVLVKEGDKVKAGQTVALMGNTGFVISGSTPFWDAPSDIGTHDHFCVRDFYESSKGSNYSPVFPKVLVRNYDNGYKGRYDPVPYFLPPEKKSTRYIKAAEKYNSKVLFEAGNIMRQIGL